jgi:hypothetical protein
MGQLPVIEAALLGAVEAQQAEPDRPDLNVGANTAWRLSAQAADPE